MSKTGKSYEELVKEMEDVVKVLENGELPLEESIKYFQRAMELSKKTTKMLDDIEGKISMLIEDSNNQVKEADFKADE